MRHTKTNCRAENGITVGLIDGIISISRVLKDRDLTDKDVQEALLDLRSDEDVKLILQPNINDALLSQLTTEDIASILDYLISPSYRTERMQELINKIRDISKIDYNYHDRPIFKGQ